MIFKQRLFLHLSETFPHVHLQRNSKCLGECLQKIVQGKAKELRCWKGTWVEFSWKMWRARINSVQLVFELQYYKSRFFFFKWPHKLWITNNELTWNFISNFKGMPKDAEVLKFIYDDDPWDDFKRFHFPCHITPYCNFCQIKTLRCVPIHRVPHVWLRPISGSSSKSNWPCKH